MCVCVCSSMFEGCVCSSLFEGCVCSSMFEGCVSAGARLASSLAGPLISTIYNSPAYIFRTIRYMLGYSSMYPTLSFEAKLCGGSTRCQRVESTGRGMWVPIAK